MLFFCSSPPRIPHPLGALVAPLVSMAFGPTAAFLVGYLRSSKLALSSLLCSFAVLAYAAALTYLTFIASLLAFIDAADVGNGGGRI